VPAAADINAVFIAATFLPTLMLPQALLSAAYYWKNSIYKHIMPASTTWRANSGVWPHM
jgi:hypothetical protein